MKDALKRVITFILYKESQAVLKKYKPHIVAVTGTVGKTSTKDGIHTAISRFVYARKNAKSLNSELGVPLTILGAKNPTRSMSILGWARVIVQGLDLIILPNHYPEWLVLEVGTDRPGDIASITRWLKPDVVVVTKLSKVPVHVEAFPTPEALFKEKGNLVRALKPKGALILNADDEDVLAYRTMTDEEVLLFGMAPGSDIQASNYHMVYNEAGNPTGIAFDISALSHKKEEEGAAFSLTLTGTLGEHHVYHALAALCVCELLGEDLSIAIKALEKDEPLVGRMHIVEGIKESVIIDDTYNSSPIALEKALETLKAIKRKRGKRKIAVLGDMLELGRFSIDEHKKAGEHAAKVVDILVTVGVRARSVAEGATGQGMDESNIFQFDEATEAGVFLQNFMKEGDVVLVKGSQGVRCERVIEEIMEHPEDKESLLVRQDAEWQLRK